MKIIKEKSIFSYIQIFHLIRRNIHYVKSRVKVTKKFSFHLYLSSTFHHVHLKILGLSSIVTIFLDTILRSSLLDSSTD